MPASGPPAVDKAAGLRELIEVWPVGGDRPDAVFAQALAYADSLYWRRSGGAGRRPRRSPSGQRPAGPWAPTGYCFVDPDGFVADRAYDLGVTLRDWCGRLRGRTPATRRSATAISSPSGVGSTGTESGAGGTSSASPPACTCSFGAERVGGPFLDTAALLLD